MLALRSVAYADQLTFISWEKFFGVAEVCEFVRVMATYDVGEVALLTVGTMMEKEVAIRKVNTKTDLSFLFIFNLIQGHIMLQTEMSRGFYITHIIQVMFEARISLAVLEIFFCFLCFPSSFRFHE